MGQTGPGDALLDPHRCRAVQQATDVATTADTGLRRLTELATRLLGADFGFVTLVGPEREVVTAATGSTSPLPDDLPVEESVCLRLVRSGQPLLVPDLLSDPDLRDLREVHAFGLRAYAGTPITDRAGLVLGAFCVASTTPRRWTASEAALLADLAASVTTELHLRVALADLRAEAAVTRRRVEEQAALYRVASAVAGGEPPEVVLRQVADELTALLEVSAAVVLRFLPDGSAELAVPAQTGGELALGDVASCANALARVRGTGRSSLGANGDVPCAAVPIVVGGRSWGAIVALTTRATTRGTLEQLERLAHFVVLVVGHAQAQTQLLALARTDPLTGAGNRRAFDERVDGELDRSRRHAHPLMLALLDVDHFKRINDEHGHAVGDRVLRELTDRIRKQLRTVDLLARIGGDEYALLLLDTDVAAGTSVLERVRRAVADAPMAGVGVTVTLGGAVVRDGRTDAEALYRAADAALYRAKLAERGSFTVQQV